MNQYLSSVSEQFKNLGDGYDISWNTDFSEISYKFDSALSKQDQSNYFTYTETIGMLNQLLKGIVIPIILILVFITVLQVNWFQRVILKMELHGI